VGGGGAGVVGAGVGGGGAGVVGAGVGAGAGVGGGAGVGAGVVGAGVGPPGRTVMSEQPLNCSTFVAFLDPQGCPEKYPCQALLFQPAASIWSQ